MTEQPIVNIVDVEPTSIQVPRDVLDVGDTVFDVYGGKYRLVKVTQFKNVTRAKRDDGEWFWLYGDDTITIIPGGGKP